MSLREDELLAPAALDNVIRTHAVRERNAPVTAVDYAVEALRIRGYAVLRSGLSPDFITELRGAVDAVYAAQCERFGGEANLTKLNDANIARAPCAEDARFIAVAMDSVMHAVCHAILGEYFILMSQNGILNVPNTDHYQFTWHRDLNYQHWTSSRPLALSALLCIDPFDAVTGGTYVLPASHKVEAFPSDAYVRQNQLVVQAAPGDWVLFDSMMFHRIGRNNSAKLRRAVNHIIVPPFLRQQFSFPNMLAGKLQTDAERRFFGEGMEAAPDATQWRAERLARLR
jgi:ectoine hydroxylase-related dioxygenase (phytanoyl-CoA dioxygenase family)